ncbi:MAG: lysophospholipid acyltransferase family protein [Hyphomicrobiales bacterium]
MSNLLIRLLFYLISLLPFFLLHVLSEFMYILTYYIIGYRKKIVKENIKNSFPDIPKSLHLILVKSYYQHLCDLIVEIIKVPGMTREQLKKRVRINNRELLDKIYSQNKSVLVTTGHIGNWEWAGSMIGISSAFKGMAVVKPISNKFIENFFNKGIRQNFYPTEVINFKSTYRALIKHRDKSTLTVIAADQTPTKSEIGYQTKFMNQDTGFFVGVEKMAKALDLAVVYMNTKKVGRSKYEIDLKLITENPKDTGQFEITKNYISCLERSILEQPYNWLWSHKRWKHKLASK